MLQRALRALTVLAALLSTAGAGADEYRLKIGDTLELTITGVNLQRRMTVDVDGRISAPLAGELTVVGSTVANVLSHLRNTLPSKSLNIRTIEGRDSVTVIAPEEISLVVAEYTAIFLNGDVARPGAQAFRPGMTVRQAIAIAGGYDLLRFRVDNPTIGGIDLQDEYRSSWSDLERALARLALAGAELKRPPAPRRTPAFPNPLSADARKEIAASEAAQFKSRLDTYRSQRTSLERSVAGDESNVKVLTAQRKTEEESYKFDLEESERVADLFRKGTVPVTRVSEARRLTLLSATRVLQVGAQLESTQRQRLLTVRELDRLDSDWRTELVTAVQEAETTVRKADSRLQAVWDKLLFTTAMRSQLASGGRGSPRLEIVRKADGEIRKFRGEEDTSLEPSDVVEVRLHMDVDQFEARN